MKSQKAKNKIVKMPKRPQEAWVYQDRFPSFLIKEGDNSKECLRAMKINDRELLEDKVREDRLKRLFKRYGYSIRFVN